MPETEIQTRKNFEQLEGQIRLLPEFEVTAIEHRTLNNRSSEEDEWYFRANFPAFRWDRENQIWEMESGSYRLELKPAGVYKVLKA